MSEAGDWRIPLFVTPRERRPGSGSKRRGYNGPAHELAYIRPGRPSGSGWKYSPAVPGRLAEDPGIFPTSCRRASVRSAGQLSNCQLLYMLAALRRARAGTWDQQYNQPPRANRQDRWSLPCASRLEPLPLNRALGSLWTSSRSGLHNLHLLSGDDGIRRICNHLFIALETRNDLDLLAEIATRRHRREHRAAVVYNCHLQTLRPKYKRGNRDQKGGGLLRHLEVDL